MKRRDWLRTSMAAALGLLRRRKLCDASQSTSAEGADAASIYRKFLDIRTPEEIGEGIKRALKNDRDSPLPSSVIGYLDEKSSLVASILREGAEAARCSWGGMGAGEAFEASFELMMPFRSALSISLLQARRCFANGRVDHGLDTVFDAWISARKYARFRLAISLLISWGSEHEITEELASQAPRLPRSALADIRVRLGRLPGAVLPSESVLAEKEFMRHYLLTEMDERDEPVAQPSEFDRKVREARKAGRLDGLIAEAGRDYDEAARVVAAPVETVVAGFDRFRSARSRSIIFKEAEAGLSGLVTAWKGIVIKRRLFNTGLDVLERGPAELSRILDPETGGPLIHRFWPGGFRLESRFQLSKTHPPVGLTFGTSRAN